MNAGPHVFVLGMHRLFLVSSGFVVVVAYVLVGCGRTSLGDGDSASPSTKTAGAATSTTSTGGAPVASDPCQLGPGPTKIADLDPALEVRRISVDDGVVTFTGYHPEVEQMGEFIDLYQVSACGGSIAQIAGQAGADIPAFVKGTDGLYFGLVPRMANDPKVYLHNSYGNTLFASTPVEPDGLLFEDGDLYSYLRSTQTVRRLHASGNPDYLGSAGSPGSSTNCVLSEGAFRFVSSSISPAPILGIPESGGALEVGPVIPLPRQIRSVEGGLVAAYTYLGGDIGLGTDYGNIERIAISNGASEILASGQFNPTGLTVRQGAVLWMADGVVRSVPLTGGQTVDRYGTSFGTSDAEQTNLSDLLAADDFAFYVVIEGAIVRVPLAQ